jgi:selenocysteine-specific elongation factor
MSNTCNSNLPTEDNPDARTVCLTVGTAGHIDHGKTQLTIFLTGCNTDKLPEEKSRGMTIDLGFATCTLPNNRRIGIVDVPGHEKFVHNMVAGATGIDVVLLVIAADDGVMPQTIEHFHILRLLGIKAGMIAITKTDLVESSRVDDVVEQAKMLVHGSFLDGAPVVPVSTKTGEGYDEFYTQFVAMVDKMSERDCSGPFRMHIERSFVLKGLGTVISGIPVSGSLRTGESLELLPIGRKVRVKGLQVYGRKADQGRAGECVAVNLADIQHDDIGRGMLLCAPDFFEPARFFDVRFFSLPSLAKPIKPRTQIRLHLGTSDVPGHLVLPSNDSIAPGTETYAQIQLKGSVVAAPGDTFILRTLSPVTTIGGGYIVAPDDKRLRRRHRDAWTSDLQKKEKVRASVSETIMHALDDSECDPMTATEISKAVLLNEDTIKPKLEQLVSDQELLLTPKNKYVGPTAVRAASRIVLERLTALHEETPLSAGFSKKAIYSGLTSNRDVLEMALSELVKSEELTRSTHGYFITAMDTGLSDAQASIAERILNLHLTTRFVTPRRDDVPEQVDAPEKAVTKIMNYLLQTGRLVDIGANVVLHPDLLAESKEIIVDYLADNESLDTGSFKGMLDSTRKYSIPILEYWDSKGLTKRVGNSRILK